MLEALSAPAAAPVVPPQAEKLVEAPPVAPPQAEKAVEPPPPVEGDTLEALAATVAECRKCGLCETRRQTVFGVGNPNADLVFVGEAPGADEDRQGIPFVGRAGQLLTDIIEKGMKLRREDVYICNVLKCRPPDNRNPSPEEVFYCEPFLLRQLELIQPKVICALGKFAAHSLLKTEDSVARMRGKWHDYHGIPLRVTYHPSYLLRKPEDKKFCWQDVQEIMKRLEVTA
jgi:DNA polymerase